MQTCSVLQFWIFFVSKLNRVSVHRCVVYKLFRYHVGVGGGWVKIIFIVIVEYSDIRDRKRCTSRELIFIYSYSALISFEIHCFYAL